MGDGLREPVVTAAESLLADLAIGRHGDPHVAFAVLVYPDRQPTVVALAPAGACDLTRISVSKEPREDARRFFTPAELDEAKQALDQAHLGLVCARGDDAGRLIGEFIERAWARSRQYPIDRALAAAAEAAARPAVCLSCKRRFTERGLPAHLRMNQRCAARVAASRHL